MQSKVIVSRVPYQIKANMIKRMMDNDVTKKIPFTLLKTNENNAPFPDEASVSELPKGM